MKKKKILGAVAAIFAAIVCAAPMTACGEFKGEAIALDCFRGAGMTGEYDSSVFYRNDLTVFGGDSDVIWVSKEQDPENGGYFYQYTSGNGGVYTQWNEEDRSYGFSCLRSRDLNDWELCGAVDGGYSARLERADWIKQNLWAPEVIYDDVTGKYYMFFSAMSWTDEAHLAGYKNAYGEGRDYNPNNYHMTVFVADVPQGPFRALTSEEYYTFEGETVQKNEAGETINRNGDVIRSKYPVINIEDHFDLETYAKNTWGEDYKTSSEYNGGVLNAGTMPGIDCSPFIDYDEQGNRKIYLFFSVHWIKGVLAIWGMEMKDWCTPNYETMRMIAYPNAQSVTYTGEGAGVWDYNSYKLEGVTNDYEGSLVEGAQMLAHTSADGKKRYYLTYSHTGYAARDYGCHQAVSEKILGDDYKYEKLSRERSALGVNATNDYMTGVGHNAYVEADGELYNVYWVHGDPTNTTIANQNGRVYAFDRQTYAFDPEFGYDILFGNGPTKFVQPLPKVASGLSNVADKAKVTATNAADGKSVKYLTDGCVAMLDYFFDMEYRAKGKTVITLEFDEPREIRAIMIYNSARYDYAFGGASRIFFTLAEKPAWYNPSAKYTGIVGIADLKVPADSFSAADPDNAFMRQGGGAVASFNPIKVSKIEIEISNKLSDKSKEIRVSEICVLGK